jgi:glutamine cyclotransferase
MRILLFTAFLVVFAYGSATHPSIPEYSYEVLHTYPHDRRAFTEGLFYLNGFLYEGTRLRGRSSVRKVKLETGQVLQKYDIPEAYFGEWVQGEIYANIWHEDRIARINAVTGEVTGWIDLTGLLPRADLLAGPEGSEQVLNGIAYDSKRDRLFVTGKYWPKLFEIRLRRKP